MSFISARWTFLPELKSVLGVVTRFVVEQEGFSSAKQVSIYPGIYGIMTR